MNFFKYKRNRKRVWSAILIASLLAVVPAVGDVYDSTWNGSMKVFATSAEEKKREAEQGLSQVEETIENVKDEQSGVNDEIAGAAKELEQLLKDQEKLQATIEETQKKVDQANQDLEAAREKEAEEYASMKLRIQFMYENNTQDSFWTAILESEGIADILNRVEYISNVYQSDRELMDAYQRTVQQVEDLTIQLGQEMEALFDLQVSYEQQQDKLEKTIAKLQSRKDEYARQLAAAEQQRDEYKKTIATQEEIIRRQEAAAARVDSTTYEGGGTGNAGLGSASYLTDPNADPAFTSSVSGTELVNYALQFVGNRYVWGGNSLTQGCDCSGFVHLIYEHFGFSVPRYSQDFAYVGQPVAYENIKAGDIVVYPGHVAIYIGNGCIVEAQSTKAGITCTRSVNCHTITAIRRVL